MNINSITDINGVLSPAAAENSISTPNTYFSNYMDQASLNYGDYLEQVFQKASDTYQVSKDLLKAMAKAESNFRADATSHCGAMGIMQLMPATAASLGVSDAYNPEQNIMGGAKYLAKLLDKYDGDTKLALAAYNAGSGNVAKYGGIPPFKETQNYVKRVLEYAGEDFNTNQMASMSPSNGGIQNQAQTVSAVYDSEYGDISKMMVQMMQLEMQQKLQSILGADTDDNGISGTVL